jgi:hypothetical protein
MFLNFLLFHHHFISYFIVHKFFKFHIINKLIFRSIINCLACMANVRREYGYEYLGVGERLV